MRARRPFGAGLPALAALLMLSCNPLSLPFPQAAAAPVVQHLPYTGSFTYTVDPEGTPSDVYFVFTNPSLVGNALEKPTVQTGSISVDGVSVPLPRSQPLAARDPQPQTLAGRIAEFNRDPSSFLSIPAPGGPSSAISSRPAQTDAVGQTDSFVLDIDAGGNPTSTVNATCRLATGQVDLGDGRRRALSIWVDSANWDPSEADPERMSPLKIQAFADRFLRVPAAAADIYHWSTAAVGEPWGAHSDSLLIPWDPNATVTILLCNLNASYAGSVIVGYFWAKDNFTVGVLPGSNQRIMFYIDATLLGMLSGTESAWSTSNVWPKIVISTLAHEFQHMIHFYQKQVLQGAPTGTDTWINELCSMALEDLVADKLGVEGPRGVITADGSAGPDGITAGRIPGFNAASSFPLAVTAGYDLTDYSVTYAFGAWLTRNYGGVQLLRRVVQSPLTSPSAVVAAAAADSGRQDESMDRLLQRWAASVLLSGLTTAPGRYRYNTGGWIVSAAGGVTYNLGSIDFSNYTPALSVSTSTGPVPPTAFSASSNVYFRAAQQLASARTWTISVPEGIRMSVVVSESQQ